MAMAPAPIAAQVPTEKKEPPLWGWAAAAGACLGCAWAGVDEAVFGGAPACAFAGPTDEFGGGV
jgi:hypothetical protein